MRSLPLIRTEYWNLSTTPPTPRSGATALSESLTDVENYLLPQAQNHAANLYTWGVADGLSVSAVPHQPGLTIAPGVALDAAGQLIALAAHGVAIVDPTVDPHEVRNIPTVSVGLEGLVLSTAGLSGEYFLTLTWREVFRDNPLGTAPVLLHAPWLRLLGIAGFPDTGDQVILARVSLAATGLVTALAADERRLVGLPASRLELRCPRATSAPSLRVEHVPAAELRARLDGGLDLNLLPPSGPPRPALRVEGLTGHLALAPQGGNVGIGTTTAPTQKLEVVGTVKATAFQGNGAELTNLSVMSNAVVAGGLTVRGNVDIGTGASPSNRLDVLRTSLGTAISGRCNIPDAESQMDAFGVYGEGDTGMWAKGRYTGLLVNGGREGVDATGTFAGIVATGRNYGVWAQGATAGQFRGDVSISGTLFKSSGAFKIDHPLDPANKYLSHSFVESPEMLNMYRGNITTNDRGEATIDLPDYFAALNRDFSYHLTVIGQMAQAAVTTEIHDNRFTVQTDRPGVTVSWLVIGVRQDPWANAHRIPVEEAKPQAERAFYLHPEVHEQPATQGIVYAQYPELLQRAAPNS